MKFICCGDLHLKSTAPKYRCDDYIETQFKKVKWILLQAKLHRATIIIAGDLFDSPKVPYEITNKYLKLFKSHKLPLISVMGQHDQRYHSSNTSNTPFETLVAAQVLSMNSTEDIQCCSWNDKIPKEGKPILLIHKCITEKKPPFFLEDAISAETMLRNYPNYKYIVSGDYHVPHTTEKNGRWLINVGSLTRSNINQIDFKPRVYLLNTLNNSVGALYLPIKPAKKVFDMNRLDRDNISNKEVNNFVQNIKVKTNKPNFKVILTQVISQAKPKQEIKNIINDILEDI